MKSGASCAHLTVCLDTSLKHWTWKRGGGRKCWPHTPLQEDQENTVKSRFAHILPLRQVRFRRWQNEEERVGARTRARGAGVCDIDEEVSSLPPVWVHWPRLKRLRQPELQKERTVPGPQHAPLFIPPHYRPAAPLSLLSAPHTLTYTCSTNRCTGSMPDYYISWWVQGEAESSHPASQTRTHTHTLDVMLQRSKHFSLEPAQL